MAVAQRSRCRWLRVWLCLLVLAGLVGCSRGSQDLPEIEVGTGIEPDPPHIGPATVTIDLHDAQARPIEEARLELEGNMNHAGMVPVFSQATEVAPGRYEATLEFTMAGDWFILVRAHLPDGRSLERKIDVPGVVMPSGETPVQ